MFWLFFSFDYFLPNGSNLPVILLFAPLPPLNWFQWMWKQNLKKFALCNSLWGNPILSKGIELSAKMVKSGRRFLSIWRPFSNLENGEVITVKRPTNRIHRSSLRPFPPWQSRLTDCWWISSVSASNLMCDFKPKLKFRNQLRRSARLQTLIGNDFGQVWLPFFVFKLKVG